jgi:hypothetical protein
MATTHLTSIGFLAQQWQLSVVAIQDAIDATGTTPTMTINGVSYYDENAHGRVWAYLINNRVLERFRINLPPVEVFPDAD